MAIATFNHANGFFVESPDGGWELNFVLIGMLGALTLIGAGAWSIDRAVGLARAARLASRAGGAETHPLHQQRLLPRPDAGDPE